MRLFVAVLMVVISVITLESARHGVQITRFEVGQTPVVEYALAGSDGPSVIVAHGFAGSQQMMQGYALPLARAGYRVFSYEFLGHGRHTLPMSGDLTSVDGTTRLLVQQTVEVMDAVVKYARPIALLGHSMATDILVRVAASRANAGPIVLISAFSKEIDADTPNFLLHVTGAWEPGLRQFALKSLQMVDPRALEGGTATHGPVSRRAVVAPFTEHVSVLQSRTGRQEALVWLDRFYGRTSAITILPTGFAILALLLGLVVGFRPVCQLLDGQEDTARSFGFGKTAIVLIVPTLLAPICAVTIKPDVMPVLVADYLALHLLVFGAVQLAFLRTWRIPFGSLSGSAIGALMLACIVFGVALDRYAANFWPTVERLWIILAMSIGTIPYMVADAVLAAGHSFLKRFAMRASVFASLGIAVALDFENLFFLILIAPVLLLFYLVFGTMGREASLRTGPLSSGLVLGLVLAWALGVSFPLFKV